MLQNQGWVKFSCINEPYYPRLVHFCHCYLHYKYRSFTLETCYYTQTFFDLFPIPYKGEEYFLSSHQLISNVGPDKLTVHHAIFNPNTTPIIEATATFFVSSDLSLVRLVVGHNILPKGGVS